jgi:hypothetical protein
MYRILVRTSVVFVLLSPVGLFAQPTPGRDITLTVARHDIRGTPVNYRAGALVDALTTGHIRPSSQWSALAAGGAGAVYGRMPECAVQPDGACAPSGNFLVLNTLVGIERRSGRAFGRLFAGPSLHHGNDATSVGIEGRVVLSVPLDHLVGVGITVRATRLPSHRGEALTLWAYGGSVTF